MSFRCGGRATSANIACRDAIEDAIRRNFDGMHLDKDCLTPVLDEYGYKRTAVGACRIPCRSSSGTAVSAPPISSGQQRHYIPQDERHNADITVRSHPAVLDGFVSLYRKAYQKLDLFGSGALCR
ncbi:MAG: DUF3849 domain-containing protein [Dysosmobacter sp.]